MTQEVKLSHPLRRFLQVLLLLWLVTLAMVWTGGVFHWPAKNWYPLFQWQDRFTDFTLNLENFKYFRQPQFFKLARSPIVYPAPAQLTFECFYLFGSVALDAYLFSCLFAVCAGAFLLGAAMLRRGLERKSTLAFLVLSAMLSYPMLFMADRGNIEIVNAGLVALGIAAYWNKRWYLAATFFGIAVSFKIFPFVFLGLLLSSRKYLAVLYGIAICALTSIASLWVLGPTFSDAVAGIATGLQYQKTDYVLQIRPLEIGFDHSAFAVIKILTFQGFEGQQQHYLPLLKIYMAVAALGGILLYFWRIRRLPRANQILTLTVASVLLPPFSGDYTLVHLYIPWAVLVLISIQLPEGKKVPGLVFCFVCLAFLMAPESYLVFLGLRFAGQVKALVLLMLFLASMTYPFPESEVGVVSYSKKLDPVPQA